LTTVLGLTLSELNTMAHMGVTRMASIEGTRISARKTADLVKIYISAHSASDLRLV
jgi:hypothetical protein